MGEKQIMTHKYLLSLNKVCDVTVMIYASAIKSRTRHILTSSTDVKIIIGEFLILTMYL